MTWRKEGRLLAALVVALAIIGLTMASAIRRGMDHAVMIGPGDQTAIAISFSNSLYGLNLGYIGYRKVFDTIQSYWNRDASGWDNLEQLKSNFHNRELLNAGIRAAASLGPQAPGYISDGTLITTYYDDMGEVDYVSIAFKLFGRRVESLFYFYFVLLALSAIVFVLAFQNHVFALGLLYTTLFAYYIELYLKFFEPVGMPTYWGMRHSSTLCLVPTLHLALLLLLRKKLSLAIAAGAMLQVILFIFIWRIRGSVAWAMVFLFGFAVTLAAIEIWPRSFEQWPRTWITIGRRIINFVRSAISVALSGRVFVRHSLRWPLVFLISGILANGLYNRLTLHPVYDTDDILAYHGIWHSVHLGLTINAPDVVSPKVMYIIRTEGLSDNVTVWSARDYLDRIHLIPWNGKPELVTPAPGYLSTWHGIGVRQAWHDRTLRSAYFDILINNPVRMLWLYAAMPLNVLRVLITPFSQAPSLAWLWLIIAAGAGVLLMLLSFPGSVSLTEGGKIVAVGAAAMATATLPNLVSYVATQSMADSILLIMSVASAALGFGTYSLISWVRPCIRRTAVTSNPSAGPAILNVR